MDDPTSVYLSADNRMIHSRVVLFRLPIQQMVAIIGEVDGGRQFRPDPPSSRVAWQTLLRCHNDVLDCADIQESRKKRLIF